ncbi:GDNF family receptor alpha-4 isoform X2 [Camelus dromedarius]|uniref:GDNF family receptor alpha-4 isoform X2 n=1 Tax=Camelus dromedarius TaxID=9838 RepID=UPI00311A45FC
MRVRGTPWIPHWMGEGWCLGRMDLSFWGRPGPAMLRPIHPRRAAGIPRARRSPSLRRKVSTSHLCLRVTFCPLGFGEPSIFGRRDHKTGMKCAYRARQLQPPTALPGSSSSAAQNRCVDAAEACTANARCHRLRTEYVAQCLRRAAPGGCPRARCRRALRRFFARGPPALTHALLFCPCGGPACAERRRQTFVPACAFSGPGLAPPSCLVPLDACEHSQVCRCGKGAGAGARAGWAGLRPPAHSPASRCVAQAPPPGLPGLLRARPQRPGRLPAGPGPQLPARLRGPRAEYPAFWVPAGTAVTPNYLDNASARVAPWCDCGASGNRREECEAFRGLFTRNRCLDSAIQTFDGGWLPILQDQLDPHRDPEHSVLQVSSADGPLGWSSLLSMLPVLALQPLL